MISKHTQNPKTGKDSAVEAESSPADHSSSASSDLTLAMHSLVEAQLIFIQQWLRTQAEPLALEMWQWLGNQALNKYVTADDIQRLINDWLLNQPMSDMMRADIRDILQSLIYHPANGNVPLSELIDSQQVNTLATYIGGHEQQRNILIHTLIGNETFADLLTQTLYHAINDFMETTLDKAGGVGKLMKLGRSSFEKATNRNLDEKLQAYLHRNIKDLAHRAEDNAQAHLTNEEVSRLLISGWDRIKDQPVSQLQMYLDDTPGDSSIIHIEAGVQHSYNRLRESPYLHSLVAASVDTWYTNHEADTIATVAASLAIDKQAMAKLSKALLPIAFDALESQWVTDHIRKMLVAFYSQPTIKDNLAFGIVGSK